MNDMPYKGYAAPQPADLLNKTLDVVDALVVVCQPDGTIIQFNRKCEELTGYTAAEMLGLPVWKLIPDDELDAVVGVVDKVYAGDFPNRHVNHWRVRDGQPALISWHNNAIIDDSGRVRFLIATGIDITDSKRLETSFRAAIDSFEDGFALYDQDDRLVALNGAFWTFFGDLRDCIKVGMTFREIGEKVFYNTDLKEKYERFEDYWAERANIRNRIGHAYVREYAPGRYLRSRNFNTSDGGFAAFITDITATKQYDETLTGLLRLSNDATLRTSDRLQQMLDIGRRHFAVGTGILTRVAGGTSTIEHVSTADPVFQVGGTIPIGESYSHFFVNAESVTCFEDVEHSVVGDHAAFKRKPLHSMIGVPVKVSGVTYGALYFASNRVAAQPFSDEDRRLVSLFGEWAGMQLRLETVISELDNFAYVASHDLKAPLRAIDNLSQWIEEDAGDTLTDETRSYLTLLRGRVARLEKLLNDLLEFSRAGRVQGDPRPVDTAKTVQDTIELVGANPAIEIVVKTAMPVVDADPVSLTQIFGNLISNAVKHHDGDSGKVEISVAERDEFWEFCVEDDGPGIPPEFRNRIFEIFQTLRPRDEVEGSGMGLAIVKKLVDSAGGRISVAGRDGGKRGAAIRFTWPKSKARTEA